MAPLALTTLVIGCLVGLSSCQSNYVDDGYEYEAAPQPARARPAPRPAPSRPSYAAEAPRPTPVPILKQINRHNEDGSYTYGYEGADGSFKIETKLTTGEVMGKYGYVDDVGKVRVVEYGANKYGFMPAGEGITVAAPTLVDETRKNSKGQVIVDDGQYYPEEYADDVQPTARPAPRTAPRPAPRPAPIEYAAPRPAPRPAPVEFAAPRPAPRPAPVLQEYVPQTRPRPQPVFQPAHQPLRAQESFGPAPPRPQIFANASPASESSRPLAPSRSVFHSVPARPSSFSAGFQPALTRPSAPVYEEVPRPAPARIAAPRGGGGILDQLERDYALPQGGSTVADVRFSSY